MPPANKLDLNKYVTDPDQRVEFTISIKPPETESERSHRLAREADDARFSRTKDLIILVAVLLGIGAILALCLWLAAGSNSATEDKKWATAILASVVTLGMGYLVGKSQASK